MAMRSPKFAALSRLSFAGAALVCGACGRGGDSSAKDRPPDLARGDVVVVERAAADFFEGRVLSVSGSTLKIQTSDDGEPLVVSRSDVYPVGAGAHRFAAGDPAICNEAAARWVACRITAASPQASARLASGDERPFAPAALLVPTPVTALNIQRFFKDIEAQRRFDDTARRAGHPVRPSGWTPERREPVLARRGDEWFSAHAAGPLEDGGVRVQWEGSEGFAALPGGYVVPYPPFSHTFVRGEFALIRPGTAAEPWQRVRIDGLSAEEAAVVTSDGQRRKIEPRMLVPLSGGIAAE
jgi:hypothetical protein